MTELQLKYGCNPNQSAASVSMKGGGALPFEVLNGRPGYINLLDALNGYALVRELAAATRLAAAASFKHVSPAGAAVAIPLDERERASCFAPADVGASALATAYARARGADRMSSFGDFAVVSERLDVATARLLASEVSDGVIAPAYEPAALDILRAKRGGSYCVLKIDPDYEPAELECKDVYGVTFTQARNAASITPELLANVVTARRDFTEAAVRDLLVALITLKYTQSNSVCFAYRGGAIGVGAGQQSRIHCTRLAASKADLWFLRQSDEVLGLAFKDGVSRADKNNFIDCYLNGEPLNAGVLADAGGLNLNLAGGGAGGASYAGAGANSNLAGGGADLTSGGCCGGATLAMSAETKREILSRVRGVSLASDAFFPFSDNIDRAARSGVEFISEPGGSVRDDAVIEAADKYGIVMAFSGLRLFHH